MKSTSAAGPSHGPARIQRLLIANRGEIAIRVMRAANELGIRTVAIYSHEDRFSLHRTRRTRATSWARARARSRPISTSTTSCASRAKRTAMPIHPGYGFLSENPEFAEACAAAGLIFIGPTPDTMRRLGNKVSARNLAVEAGVPVMPATPPLPRDLAEREKLAAEVGYPVMLKASWGGGGRGMRIVESAGELEEKVAAARREAKAAFGNDEVYLEKLIRRARHVEVQLLGDHARQPRAPVRARLLRAAPQPEGRRARAGRVHDAGAARGALRARAEDRARGRTTAARAPSSSCRTWTPGKFYFIEVNPRIQVEHTVTEMVTGIDIVKAQIRVSEGARIGDAGVRRAAAVRDPHQRARAPVPRDDRGSRRTTSSRTTGVSRPIAARRASASGSTRGTAYSGALISRSYDSLLVKVTAWAPHAGGDDPAHAPRALGVPHPWRRHEPAVPRPGDHASEVRVRRLHDEVHRRDAGALRHPEAARPRDAAARLHRGRDRERQPRGEGARETGAHADAARAADGAACAGPGCEGDPRRAGPEGVRAVDARAGARARHRHDDARRAPVAARDALAHARHGRDRAALREPAAAALLASNAGAARRSTSRCGS